MQTISFAKRLWKRIATIATTNGERVYRAALGDSRTERLRQRESTGKTAGAALDALTVAMGSEEINGFLLLQNHQPDRFFTAQQQQRLTELMSIWRTARDRGDTLPPEQQAELDDLIEAELAATAERAKAILALPY